MKKISFVVMLFVVTNVLSGCGNGGGSSEASNVADGLVSITSNDSPLSGHTGVLLDVDDDSQLFLLSENVISKSLLEIDTTQYEGADMSNTIGETFYSYSWGNNPHPVGVVKTADTMVEISECDFEYMECTSVSMDEIGENTYSFTIRPDLNYAFSIEE